MGLGAGADASSHSNLPLPGVLEENLPQNSSIASCGVCCFGRRRGWRPGWGTAMLRAAELAGHEEPEEECGGLTPSSLIDIMPVYGNRHLRKAGTGY